ncbi:UNVERIFIED_CONTAM: hypothetical protein FKN15_065094 [Acipenser sinensis]
MLKSPVFLSPSPEPSRSETTATKPRGEERSPAALTSKSLYALNPCSVLHYPLRRVANSQETDLFP